jgi:hypothetical protein
MGKDLWKSEMPKYPFVAVREKYFLLLRKPVDAIYTNVIQDKKAVLMHYICNE